MYTYVWYIVPEHWRMISWTKRIYALLSQKGKSYDMLNSIHFIGCNFALIPLAWREKEAIYLKWKQKLWEIQTFTVTITWSPFNYNLLRSSNNLTSKNNSWELERGTKLMYLWWMLYNEQGNLYSDIYLHFHNGK